MPFTFSHPAIVLPLSRIKGLQFSVSGLIIGSITPDFEYFIRMKLSGRYSHTIEGIFLLDLPLAVIIAFIFHQLVKRAMIENLPGYFYKRLTALYNHNFLEYFKNHYLLFSCSLLIGIASHIFWDGFTHENTFFIDFISFLSYPVSIKGMQTYPFYRYLQHISTLIGAVVIIYFFRAQPVVEITNKPKLLYWFLVVSIASCVFVVRATLGFEYFGDIVACIISAGIVGVICSSILFVQIKRST